ncbi:MAG: DoxX family protein [Chlamydiales bacterium]|nr:DoxX family protein [Chlamydiales bacterium]
MESNTCQSSCKSHCGRSIAVLIGRVLMGAVFIIAAISVYSNWQTFIKAVVDVGLPFPAVALSIAIVLKLLGGISLLIGYKVRLGALLLIIFIVPATLLFHHFWSVGPDQVMQSAMDFFRNVFILGALLFVSGCGASCCSIDTACCKSK